MALGLRNPFIRSIALLTSGTVLAHGITIGAMPFVTRIYSPADFSALALFSASLAILISVSSLNLQLAIPVSEDDDDAINTLSLAFVVLAFFTIILSVIVIFPPEGLSNLLSKKRLEPISWMLIPGTFLGSSYVILQMWATRRKAFSSIAATRITRAIGGTSTQIGSGLHHPSAVGLVVGSLVYNGAGVTGLFRTLWKRDRELFKRISVSRIKKSFIRHRNFMTLTTPGNLLNVISIHFPILVIGASMDSGGLGQFALATQVMAVPMILVGSSVGQVFYSEAPQKRRKGELVAFAHSVSLGLLKIGGPVFVLIGVASPFLFPWIFGDEWARAGMLVTWMTPWFVLQFVCSPVSCLLFVTGNQMAALWIQLAGTVLRVGITASAIYFVPNWSLEAFALSGAIFYGIYICVVMRLVKNDEICNFN